MAIVASACSGTPQGATSGSPVPVAGGTVTARITGDWVTLDIQGVSDVTTDQISLATYDRLVDVDKDNKVVPYLATSWTSTPTSVTFTLRTDATCSDGTKVTPDVVAASFKRLVDPKTLSNKVGRIFGPGPYTITSDNATNTFTMKFGTPNGDPLPAFAYPTAGIICPAGVADPTKLANGSAGSGPYAQVSAVHGDAVTLKLRPEWKWGPNGATAAVAGLPETLVYKVVANATTASNLLLTGGLDIAYVQGQDVPRLVADKSLIQHVTHNYATYPLLFNFAAGHPTRDPLVREALMRAVDPKAWNEAAFSGQGTLTTSLVTPDVLCYDPATASLFPQMNTVRSSQLLEQAGYTMSNGKLTKGGQPLTIKLIGTPTFYQPAGPEYLQAQFNALGITVALVNTDLPSFLSNLRGAAFDVAILSTANAAPQIGSSAPLVSGKFFPQGNNYAQIDDPVAAQAAQDALNATGSAACALWATFQQTLLKNYDYMPLSSPNYYWFGRGVDFYASAGNLNVYTIRRVK